MSAVDELCLSGNLTAADIPEVQVLEIHTCRNYHFLADAADVLLSSYTSTMYNHLLCVYGMVFTWFLA